MYWTYSFWALNLDACPMTQFSSPEPASVA